MYKCIVNSSFMLYQVGSQFRNLLLCLIDNDYELGGQCIYDPADFTKGLVQLFLTVAVSGPC